MHCRYDQLNRNALGDVELYDKTGRVRSLLPVVLSNSEEDNKVSKGKCQCAKLATYNDFSKPHIVAVISTEDEERCSTPERPQSEDAISVTSEEADSDSDFCPSNSEHDPLSTSESTASEDNNTDEENLAPDTEDESTEEEDCLVRGTVFSTPQSHLLPNVAVACSFPVANSLREIVGELYQSYWFMSCVFVFTAHGLFWTKLNFKYKTAGYIHAVQSLFNQ